MKRPPKNQRLGLFDGCSGWRGSILWMEFTERWEEVECLVDISKQPQIIRWPIYIISQGIMVGYYLKEHMLPLHQHKQIIFDGTLIQKIPCRLLTVWDQAAAVDYCQHPHFQGSSPIYVHVFLYYLPIVYLKIDPNTFFLQVFPTYSKIRRHIRSYHAILPHVCSICSKEMPSIDKLKIHMLR